MRKSKKQRKAEKRAQSIVRVTARKKEQKQRRISDEKQRLFNYFVNRSKVLEKTDVYQRTLKSLEDLGIDPNKRRLTSLDIEKLKNVSVLEQFADSTIVKNAYTPNKYLQEIGVRIQSKNYGMITNENALRTAEVFVSDIYNKLIEVGLITSREIIEYTNTDIFSDIKMEDIERGMNKLLDDYLTKKVDEDILKEMLFSYIDNAKNEQKNNKKENEQDQEDEDIDNPFDSYEIDI